MIRCKLCNYWFADRKALIFHVVQTASTFLDAEGMLHEVVTDVCCMSSWDHDKYYSRERKSQVMAILHLKPDAKQRYKAEKDRLKLKDLDKLLERYQVNTNEILRVMGESPDGSEVNKKKALEAIKKIFNDPN